MTPVTITHTSHMDECGARKRCRRQQNAPKTSSLRMLAWLALPIEDILFVRPVQKVNAR